MLSPAWAIASEVAAEIPMVPVVADGDWWKWPLILLVVTFFMGIIAVLGGVGGGVLFVPIISGFFPFHLDFVRGTGLLVALCGALAAGPGLLKANLASLRLALPIALIASTMAIVGAMVGLALPTHIVQLSLGITILGIVAIMLAAKKSTIPDVPQADNLSSALRICGIYHEPSMNQDINWKVHRTPLGLATFIIIGFMEDLGGHLQVPALHHRHLCCLDLCEQRLRYPDDGCPFPDRYHARLLYRRSSAESRQTHLHPLDGYRHPALCRPEGDAQSPHLHGRLISLLA
jgi:uncharacterized membrane protein YfcA